MLTAFPRFDFAGSHRAIGEQYGEACRERIVTHRDHALERLDRTKGINRERALRRTGMYRSSLVAAAPYFIDELEGLAAGAGISLGEAWLLQLRAEVAVVGEDAARDEPGDECTSFAAEPAATQNGVGLIGQNADLPPFYRDVAVVASMCFDDGMPSILMLLPAGQLSYLGINDRGMGAFANFLSCDGWRVGVPRYFFTRMVLSTESLADARSLITSIDRASSRNLMMMDGTGTALNIETAPQGYGEIRAEAGLLAHSNHFVSPDLLHLERAKDAGLENSRERLRHMNRLLRERRGRLSVDQIQDVLRNRDGFPDCVCRGDGESSFSDSVTFASLIAEPSRGCLHVAVGPPHEHEYVEHGFPASH